MNNNTKHHVIECFFEEKTVVCTESNNGIRIVENGKERFIENRQGVKKYSLFIVTTINDPHYDYIVEHSDFIGKLKAPIEIYNFNRKFKATNKDCELYRSENFFIFVTL